MKTTKTHMKSKSNDKCEWVVKIQNTDTITTQIPLYPCSKNTGNTQSKEADEKRLSFVLISIKLKIYEVPPSTAERTAEVTAAQDSLSGFGRDLRQICSPGQTGAGPGFNI